MRFISTKTHGILDYLTGILLLLSPWIWSYYATGLQSLIPILLGIAILSMSLMTNYEISVLRLISMKGHLAVDVFSGLFLAVSPWIFGFQELVYIPHVAFGIFLILSGLFTKVGQNDKKGSNLI